MKKSLAALCIAIILFSGSTLLGEERNPGRHWLKLSEVERMLWVWGFAEGQKLILSELGIKVRVHLNLLILLKDASAISKIMSQYYNDTANTYITWPFMTIIAKTKLEGKPMAIIEEALELSRQTGMKLREMPKSK